MKDEQAIARLVTRYNINGDRGRVQELAACFLEDGVLDAAGNVLEGRVAMIDELSRPRGSSALKVVRHHLTTQQIDIDDSGETARGRTYFFVMTNIGPDHHGVYVDRYRKIGAQWFIEHREVRIDWQSPQSLFRPLKVRGQG